MAYQNKKKSHIHEITPVNTAPVCPPPSDVTNCNNNDNSKFNEQNTEQSIRINQKPQLQNNQHQQNNTTLPINFKSNANKTIINNHHQNNTHLITRQLNQNQPRKNLFATNQFNQPPSLSTTIKQNNFGTTSHLSQMQGLPINSNFHGLSSNLSNVNNMNLSNINTNISIKQKTGKNESIHIKPMPLLPLTTNQNNNHNPTKCNIHIQTNNQINHQLPINNFNNNTNTNKPFQPLFSSNISAFMPGNLRNNNLLSNLTNMPNITQNTFGQFIPLNSNFGTINPITNCVVPKLGNNHNFNHNIHKQNNNNHNNQNKKASSSGINSDGSIPINPHSRTSSRGSRDNDLSSNNFHNNYNQQPVMPLTNLVNVNTNLGLPLNSSNSSTISPYLTPIQTSPMAYKNNNNNNNQNTSQSNLQARQLNDPSQILNNNLPGGPSAINSTDNHVAGNGNSPIRNIPSTHNYGYRMSAQNNNNHNHNSKNNNNIRKLEHNSPTTKTFLLGRNHENHKENNRLTPKQLRQLNHSRLHGRYGHFWKLSELERKEYLTRPLDITQSIILLKHAKNCAKASGIDLTKSRLAGQTCNCHVPHCTYFRELLAHFRHCVANSAASNSLISNCGKAHCQQVKLIYYHTFTCGNGLKCQICHPGERAIYSYQRANSSNSTSTTSSSENSSTTSSISSNNGDCKENHSGRGESDSKYIIKRRLQSPKEILGCRCC